MTAPLNNLRQSTDHSRNFALPLAAAALMLAACASRPKLRPADPSLPEIDVLQLKENSDEALKLAQENRIALQSLEAKIHELENRVSSLGDELANLPTGKLEELTQQMALMTAQLHSLEDRTAKGQAPAAKPELKTFSPTALDSAGGPQGSKKGDSASAKGAQAGQTSKAAPAKPSPRRPPAGDLESAIYKKAFDLYYGRDYAGAVERFEALLKQFPSGGYADNCFYWIGECRFAQGNFNKAIASFRKVFTFKDTEKADDAQLKLGYCYLRLGDRRQAAVEFKKVVSLYPDSEYTERAKEELAKLE